MSRARRIIVIALSGIALDPLLKRVPARARALMPVRLAGTTGILD
jgi:hypothetical protein